MEKDLKANCNCSGSRFTVNTDLISIFFTFPLRHKALLLTYVQIRKAKERNNREPLNREPNNLGSYGELTI